MLTITYVIKKGVTNYTKTYPPPTPYKLYTQFKFPSAGCKQTHSPGCEAECNARSVREKETVVDTNYVMEYFPFEMFETKHN